MIIMPRQRKTKLVSVWKDVANARDVARMMRRKGHTVHVRPSKRFKGYWEIREVI